jgi:hypothetical protein
MWRLRSSCFSATCACRSSICVGILANEFVIRDLQYVTRSNAERRERGLQLGADLLREALVCVGVAHQRLHVGYGGDNAAPASYAMRTSNLLHSEANVQSVVMSCLQPRYRSSDS